MGRFLKNIALFTLLSIIAYAVLTVIWGEFMPRTLKKNLNYEIGGGGHILTRLRDAKEMKNVDVLFLGSSHTYRGFDTRIWREAGLEGFNLGSSSQTPFQTRILLERYLDNLNPKLVIYEVYPANFSSDGIESSLDIMANDQIDPCMRQLVWDQNHIKTYNTLLFGSYRQLFGLDKKVTEAEVKGEDSYVKGGFVEKDLRFYKNEKRKNNKEWKLKEDQFTVFEEILTTLNERGAKVVLVQAPITESRYRSYLNNGSYDDRMMSYGEYLNFNLRLPLDDSLHFYDSHHMNQDGVVIFNHALIDSLRAYDYIN